MNIPNKLKNFIPLSEWPLIEQDILAINKLKHEKGAVILAHNYMTPEIFHGIADIRGDSLALAREAVGIDAEIIVMCGVHFMAETVKILNPGKTVLIADLAAGCSLAEGITAADVQQLRKQYPGLPVVTYVNTSAAVKAESDICCTSGNALKIVESLPGDSVIFLPDRYLAENVAKNTLKKVITWTASCMVHERFTPEELQMMRTSYPGTVILAHPECPRLVADNSDFTGSTAQMVQWLEKNRPPKALLLTECSMSDNVAIDFPDIEFVRPCNLCPHMKRISLTKVRRTLENLSPEVLVDPGIIPRARKAIERMLEVGR